MKSVLFTFLASLAALGPAHSAELITNGGFEENFLSQSSNYQYIQNGDSSSLPGWTIIDDGIGESPYIMKLPQYGNVIAGLASLSLNQGSGVYTTFSMVAGNTYTLTFATRTVSSNPLTPLQVQVGNVWFQFPASTGGHEIAFIADTTIPNAMLKFFNASPGPDFKIYVLDSVSLSAVPEPPAGMLMALGVAMVGVTLPRRKVPAVRAEA